MVGDGWLGVFYPGNQTGSRDAFADAFMENAAWFGASIGARSKKNR
jgi:hypothetical protein